MNENVQSIARAYGMEPGQFNSAMSPAEAYAMGMESEFKRRGKGEADAVRAFASKLTDLLNRPGAVTQVEQQHSTPGTWAGFRRAAEHLVTDLDPASAATPHGVWESGAAWALELAQSWQRAAMPALSYSTLIEAPSGQGIPQLPILSTPPTAGPQGGEKTEAYSKALDITANDAATYIDSTLYLNVSELVLDTPGALPILNALLSSAVSHEANRQVAAAIQAAASSGADLGGAFGSFDGGRYVPSVIVTPPSQLLSLDAAGLAAAGVKVVIDPAVTQTLVLSPDASVGWYKPLRMQALEPSVFGQQIGYAIAGRVGVDPAGVATFAAA